jgi:hypothetical protein
MRVERLSLLITRGSFSAAQTPLRWFHVRACPNAKQETATNSP